MRDAASPANPRLILPLCLLSPRNGGDGRWPWRPGGVGRAAPPRLARRRARSPVGERAAVELAMDGTLLSSPRACAPASRRRATAPCAARRREAAQPCPEHRWCWARRVTGKSPPATFSSRVRVFSTFDLHRNGSVLFDLHHILSFFFDCFRFTDESNFPDLDLHVCRL